MTAYQTVIDSIGATRTTFYNRPNTADSSWRKSFDVVEKNIVNHLLTLNLTKDKNAAKQKFLKALEKQTELTAVGYAPYVTAVSAKIRAWKTAKILSVALVAGAGLLSYFGANTSSSNSESA